MITDVQALSVTKDIRENLRLNGYRHVKMFDKNEC